MSNVKLGITLYCFTEEYCRGEYSLEDCIRKAKEIGSECMISEDMTLSRYLWHFRP